MRVGERGGRGPERGERQYEQCGAEAAAEQGLPEGDERALRLAERDRAEQRPLRRAEEVGEQQVEAVEHEQRDGKAHVRHGNVEGGRGRGGGFEGFPIARAPWQCRGWEKSGSHAGVAADRCLPSRGRTCINFKPPLEFAKFPKI